MKRKFLFGAAALLTLAFASCRKDAGKTDPQAPVQHNTAQKDPIPGTNYFVLEPVTYDCSASGGNCIPYTIRRGDGIPGNNKLVRIVTTVKGGGTAEEVANAFMTYRSDLDMLPGELIDAVIGRQCTVEYSKMGNIDNVEWLVFKSGETVLYYLRLKTEG